MTIYEHHAMRFLLCYSMGVGQLSLSMAASRLGEIRMRTCMAEEDGDEEVDPVLEERIIC